MTTQSLLTTVESKLRQIRSSTWTVKGEPLTGEQVVAAYDAICHSATRAAMNRRVSKAIGEGVGSGRRWGRTCDVLKSYGLIRYNRKTRAWEAT